MAYMEAQQVRFIKEKLDSPLYHCFLIVTIETQTDDRLTNLRDMVRSIRKKGCLWCNELVVDWTPATKIASAEDEQLTSVLCHFGKLAEWTI